MNRYIKNIHINKVRHLKDINIPLEKDAYPHLMITGKNGSGKTSLLNAIADHLEKIVNINIYTNYKESKENLELLEKEFSEDIVKHFDQVINADLYENKDDFKKNLNSLEKEDFKSSPLQIIQYNRRQHINLFNEVYVDFEDAYTLIKKYKEGNFIIAFYEAHRTIKKLKEPKTPTKPTLRRKSKIKDSLTGQFLNFLSDLKIQEALARNEKLETDAEQINEWFVNFEGLLGEIFQDKELQLTFNYKDYSFKILTEGKEFKFTELSDGFAAVLDIVVDLILKMQDKNQLTKAYECEGIVLVDEIETHLHLELQKVIMPLLTKTFPNIQFIVTTHSPFVLSSLSNAVAFDLEHQEVIEDLTEYSYESLAEGYFGVKTASSYIEMQLNRLKELLEKENLSSSEKSELKHLNSDFEEVPEIVSPLIKGRYLQLKNQYFQKIKTL
ncbi:AAA family ATPase [Capnocytophaga genosp. AHN8471]|jgi:ATPase|uniref:AAA family ATPase n=1 Tax=Capnocytophaga genosp. AHN8471 TaxID=327574 RepID=A0ABS1YYX0_9FLAO|nr:AAA family ATPase [Capnocytophaga genosp. AHN8471]MBM0651627.1 AAA family ATPase [Capnocytophaga genosp. AHN8471]MBM0662035.1 AAA family ATPase [Capnocytophaga genosp. AHN8471]